MQKRWTRTKQPLGIDVLTAARERIAYVFDSFPCVYVSFSGGKDSTVMLHLVMDEAMRRRRKVGLLFVDLEAQYKLTIQHVRDCYDLYARWIEPHWVSLPIHLRNAVSQFEPHWVCWDPDRRSDWVREPPPIATTNGSRYQFFRPGMEFEEFVAEFGHYFGNEQLTACFVGIRSDESLNRFRTIHSTTKDSFRRQTWTTRVSGRVYNAYPIYDWRTEDIWTYHGKTGTPYNSLYDLMHKAGLSIHEQRICQPYGDDQRKGLWLYHLIEPETWGRVVARVCGANAGSLYSRERGNVTGMHKISKPPGHTWQSFADLLLSSQPPKTQEHFSNKIAVFLKWYETRGYPSGIPDEGPITDMKQPSWTRICKALLRNDYWCKGLSFTQHKSEAYEKYLELMKKRRAKWGM